MDAISTLSICQVCRLSVVDLAVVDLAVVDLAVVDLESQKTVFTGLSSCFFACSPLSS
ncbi:hypothetical protein [Stieleria varia]|uniref:Uncharacterized protein n=1 Tax=Stieleria varia TaxID=2528005 RepID=A0A5C6B7Q8_9BACT|nr:hypothetical protein [Stieleria varia]TWU07990.1 hypothetical protein Pla52n_05670 [Stieleria varia]